MSENGKPITKLVFVYGYFQDPETGKFYEPKPTYTVVGEHLEQMFVEIIPISDPIDQDYDEYTKVRSQEVVEAIKRMCQ